MTQQESRDCHHGHHGLGTVEIVKNDDHEVREEGYIRDEGYLFTFLSS
jgi:hypothetical protein